MRDYEVETWAPDFDDVKEDTIILFENHPLNTGMMWELYDHKALFSFCRQNDLLRVVRLAGRPRVARVEHLRSAKQFHVRVDELLDFHDRELITILPG